MRSEESSISGVTARAPSEDGGQFGVVGTPSLGGCTVPRRIMPVKHSVRRRGYSSVKKLF